MIKADLTGLRLLKERMAEVAPSLNTRLDETVGRLALKLARHVQQDKLTGQVLQVRTGRLRRSINFRMEGQGSSAVAAYVGTNVEYARVHEFGFKGVETVREHLRTIKSGKTFTVRAHDRHVDIPEKSFLRSALDDMREQIKDEIAKATTEAIRL